MAGLEAQIDQRLSMQTGIPVNTVHFLRNEFKKLGRNALDASIEILAIENGLAEHKVKELFDLHIAQVRRLDGFAEQKRAVYD